MNRKEENKLTIKNHFLYIGIDNNNIEKLSYREYCQSKLLSCLVEEYNYRKEIVEWFTFSYDKEHNFNVNQVNEYAILLQEFKVEDFKSSEYILKTVKKPNGLDLEKFSLFIKTIEIKWDIIFGEKLVHYYRRIDYHTFQSLISYLKIGNKVDMEQDNKFQDLVKFTSKRGPANHSNNLDKLCKDFLASRYNAHKQFNWIKYYVSFFMKLTTKEISSLANMAVYFGISNLTDICALSLRCKLLKSSIDEVRKLLFVPPDYISNTMEHVNKLMQNL